MNIILPSGKQWDSWGTFIEQFKGKKVEYKEWKENYDLKRKERKKYYKSLSEEDRKFINNFTHMEKYGEPRRMTKEYKAEIKEQAKIYREQEWEEVKKWWDKPWKEFKKSNIYQRLRLQEAWRNKRDKLDEKIQMIFLEIGRNQQNKKI